MNSPHRTQRAINKNQLGSILPAALMIIFASMLLATGALRSAITETHLVKSVRAAEDAFWLAELGLQTALEHAQLNTLNLPNSLPIDIASIRIGTQGTFNATINHLGNDHSCTELDSPDVIRHHFEIRATGNATLGATNTHLQGFYLCRENCTTDFCIGSESPINKSYWKAIPGGIN